MNSRFSHAPQTSSARLDGITAELREIHELLTSGDEIDPRILSDFRDAVNRVRSTAWAVQQYSEILAMEQDANPILAVLTGERIRVAYQLCRTIQTDLANEDLRFQKGQLLRLYDAAQELSHKLREMIGE